MTTTTAPKNEAAIATAGHDAFADRILKLDRQQGWWNTTTAKRCPKHDGILAVRADGALYCADTKARNCDYLEMGVVDEPVEPLRIVRMAHVGEFQDAGA